MSKRSHNGNLQPDKLPQDNSGTDKLPKKPDLEMYHCPHMDIKVPKELCWRTEELIHSWHVKREKVWSVVIFGGFAAIVLLGGNWVWRRADETRALAVSAAERMAVKTVQDSNSVRAIQTQADATMGVIAARFTQTITDVVKREDQFQAKQAETQKAIDQQEVSRQELTGRLAEISAALTQRSTEMAKLAAEISSLEAQVTGMTGEKAQERLQLLRTLSDALEENNAAAVLLTLQLNQKDQLERLKQLEISVQQCIDNLKSIARSSGVVPYFQGAASQQIESQRLQNQTLPAQGGYQSLAPQYNWTWPAQSGNVIQSSSVIQQTQAEGMTSQTQMGSTTLPPQVGALIQQMQAGSVVSQTQTGTTTTSTQPK
jgi:hypothetical protein